MLLAVVVTLIVIMLAPFLLSLAVSAGVLFLLTFCTTYCYSLLVEPGRMDPTDKPPGIFLLSEQGEDCTTVWREQTTHHGRISL